MTTRRLARMLGLAIVAGALLVGGVARAAGTPAPVPAPQPVAETPKAVELGPAAAAAVVLDDAASACGEIPSSQDQAADAREVESPDATSATDAASCRPCKGRTWCKCTYNGMPRSSCDPCCYTNDIGVTTCLD